MVKQELRKNTEYKKQKQKRKKEEQGLHVIQSRGEKVFNVVNYIFLSLLVLITFYPFYYVLIASLSESVEVVSGNVLFTIKGFTMDSYKKVWEIEGFLRSYGNSIYMTVVGTAISLLITICGSYALSKKRLRFRSFFSFFIAFTMWFNAGMIPIYLNLRDMNMLNSIHGAIVAFCISTFNVIMMRTYFQTVPDSLEEAAKIDGANDIRTLFQIYLPLAKPSIATIGLYYGLSYWNSYFWPMIMLKDRAKVPLQVLLKKLIVEMQLSSELSMTMDTMQNVSQQTVIYATMIVSIIPVILIYPYLQKYLIKGLMVGSVKG